MAESFDWLKPSPLWQENGADFVAFDRFRPRLLAFASDSFMEEFFAAAAAANPAALAGHEAAPPQDGRPLRLYQPAHGRFYLVCASLTCRRPTFPDRAIRAAEGENIFFVLRKRVNGEEYGWISDAGWRPVQGRADSILAQEERLPLFGTAAGNGRTLLFGYLPVASRDTQEVPLAELSGDPDQADLRLEELSGRFILPITTPEETEADPDPRSMLQIIDDAVAARRTSVYLLLDLWAYFDAYLPAVAQALLAGDAAGLTGAGTALIDFLHAQRLDGSLTLGQALHAVAAARETLDALGEADLPSQFTSVYNLQHHNLDTDALRRKVAGALPAGQEPGERAPKFAPDGGDLYVFRCAYERPACEQRQTWVSWPSHPFQLAPFFDPEAPVRPIRISLPVDVSIAGLRKLKKGVSFMVSKSLAEKIEQVTGREIALLGGEDVKEKPSFDLGYICSLSIPIITICAFILLLIMVVLLNIVFWWLPFFKICFPLDLSSDS